MGLNVQIGQIGAAIQIDGTQAKPFGAATLVQQPSH
jgi:hypothetical protein